MYSFLGLAALCGCWQSVTGYALLLPKETLAALNLPRFVP